MTCYWRSNWVGLSLLIFKCLGLSQRNTGLIQKCLAFLFYLNAQGFWEISEGVYSLLFCKGTGLISMRSSQWKYKDRKIHNVILIVICNLQLLIIPYWWVTLLVTQISVMLLVCCVCWHNYCLVWDILLLTLKC